MRSHRRRACFVTVAVLAMSAAGVSLAQDAARPTVVLDTSGFWRAYYTLRTPVILNDGGKAEPLPNPCETPFPADGWRQTDFDDSTWPRLPGAPFPPVRNSWANLWKWNVGGIYMHNSTPALGLICMRGKFHVDDPGKVDGLTLSIAYRGGAVIYLNGREIVRGYLPKGKLTFATLAEVYPDEAYLYPDGSLLDHDYRRAPEVEKRYKQRNRRLEGVGVPVALLRRGTNVLAVQIHRSPYPALMRDRFAKKREGRVDSRLWDNCGLHSLRLTARTSDGLTPNVTRPGGVQVWNGDVLAADFDIDFGDPTEPLKPVTIVGTRNGVFSGKVIVGSTGPMKRFRATVGELRSKAGAKVPASAVRIRYALPTGHEAGANARYPVSASRFDALDESPPNEVPVRRKERVRDNHVLPGQPEPVFGAVQPVWVTVKVPADAAEGDYNGTLAIAAEGIETIRVPVCLKVHGWRMPDPKDFRTFVEVIQSPDSLALYYKVPPWSDEHFRLIEQSFRHIARVGNRTVYVPLICHTNLGNEQTMVRWIRKPGGGYDYDFTIMERYLDLYQKHLGRPEAVCVGVWETFLEGGFLRYARQGRYTAHEIWEDFDKAKGLGPLVTLVESGAGKVLNLQLPLYTDTEKSRPLWKPLFEQFRKRMAARGWDKQIVLGYPNDSVPTKEVVEFFKEMMPGRPWIRQSHSGRNDLHGVPYAFQTLVWSPRFLVYPQTTSLAGWRGKRVQFPRNIRDNYPLTTFRLIGEMNIMASQRGFGRLGADFWPVFKDRRGRLRGLVANRYPKTRWRNLSVATALLAPGETGPLFTVRLEMIREGVQECEARIFIEETLLDEAKQAKLGDDLVRRCNDALRERTLAVLQGLDNHNTCGFKKPNIHGWWNNPGEVGCHWYLTSNWQKRSDTLYALAAEVAAALEKR